MRDEELGKDNNEFLSNSNFIQEEGFELDPINDKNFIFLTISSSFSSSFICNTPSKSGRILSMIDCSTTVSSIVKIESMLLFFKVNDNLFINRKTSFSYTPAGDLQTINLPTGTITYIYDQAGRTKSISYGNGKRYERFSQNS